MVLLLSLLAIVAQLACGGEASSVESLQAAVAASLDALAADLIEDRPADAAGYTERLQSYLEARRSCFGTAAALPDRSGGVVASPCVHRTTKGVRQPGPRRTLL